MQNFDLKNLQSIKIPTLLGDIITIYNIVTGNIYFLAKQIAEILGYASTQKLVDILDSRECRSTPQVDLNEINDLEANIGK